MQMPCPAHTIAGPIECLQIHCCTFTHWDRHSYCSFSMSTAASATEAARTFQLVVAATKHLGIGRNGSLPWKLPGDMAYFKELTSKTSDSSKQNAVIMGRNTWESIPAKFRPLKNRLNVVLSRKQLDENDSSSSNGVPKSQHDANVLQCNSLASAMSTLTGAQLKDQIEHIFVIGGGQVYKEAIAAPECAVIHLTSIESDVECDTFFPAIDPEQYALWSAAPPQSDDAVQYHFLCYVRRSFTVPPPLPTAIASKHDEQQVCTCVGLD